MDITSVIEMNKIFEEEINKEINKIISNANTKDIDGALILQDKLVNLLLILRKENE
jgi:hypothetical protein